MLINNKELATRIRLGFMLAIFVYLVLIVLAIILHWSEKHYFELGLTAVLLLGIVWFLLCGSNYIYFNTEGSKIVLRYMPLQPFMAGHHAIEIPKSKFVQYKIKKSKLGLRTSIVLYQKTDKGISKYPPVSINSLKKSEKRDILDTLDKLSTR
ncbi:MAG: hypothetical protein U9Q98_05170 [Bacteroidota bacterium]|nr:hypothetical protein [Bacteroidota bacterium]